MASDLISRDALIARHCAENCGCTRSECGFTYADDGCDCCTFVKEIENAPAVDAEPVITGETSDGYHTFNELYHHRAILFSVIVKAFKDKAWKSRKHHDGTMYDGMFIVGVETPNGQATYHYDIEPYWNMFICKEIEFAPEWDGHTPSQAIERIGKLDPVRHGRWIHDTNNLYGCSECMERETMSPKRLKNYCPNCGVKMGGCNEND